MPEKTYVGVGLYTYPEAARIIGVDAAKLRRWVGEYCYTSRGSRYHHDPIIQRYFMSREPILTFLELLELHFVQLFRSQGVSMHTIRRASQRAAEILQVAYPFTVKRFDTDGKRIFATLSEEAESASIVEELGKGQLAFEQVVRPFFRKLDYRGDANAVAFWPMEQEGRVVLDPTRGFGKPIDAKTGIPTAVLFDAVNAGKGQSLRQVAEWFEIPIEAVEAAVAYERSLQVA